MAFVILGHGVVHETCSIIVEGRREHSMKYRVVVLFIAEN